MSNLNNSVDDVAECPLCMEPLEVDDLNFFPCTCGYQICRFCWHRIRTDENELCPACRKEYPENPADFKPLTQEDMIVLKSQKRQRDQQRKQKITENRKHLANVRVVQKNLVFVVGLPPRLADADILKKHEYFGKYGIIHKVVINPSTTYAGVQGPSASAYVTYVHNTDALRAIQSVNNIMIDGRLIKTSLGTTKYCSHFMKNQQCPKGDCMYLHELGDPEASFTKEEMHQGKHQEYEKRLHDLLIATSGASVSGGLVSTNSTSSLNHNAKFTGNTKLAGINPTASTSANISSSSTNTANNSSSSMAATGQQKEAWPSLSVSPVNQKDSTSNAGVMSNKNKKERIKQEKNKNSKTKNKNTINLISKESESSTTASALTQAIESAAASSNNNHTNAAVEQTTKSKDKSKERNQNSLSNRSNQRKEVVTSIIKEDEIKEFDNVMMPPTLVTTHNNVDSTNASSSNKIRADNTTKADSQRSLSSSSNSNNSCLMNTSDNTSPVNESVSGKSSPNSLLDEHIKSPVKSKNALAARQELNEINDHNIDNSSNNSSESRSKPFGYVENIISSDDNIGQMAKEINKENMENALGNATDKLDDVLASSDIEKVIFGETLLGENKNDDALADTISKLNLFDENSFFSSTPGAFQQSMLMKNKHSEDTIPNQFNSGIMHNMPDLINGIDGYQNNTNDWEEAFKNVMLETNKQMEQQNLHQQQLHHQHHQFKHQEDLHRLQEIQKRNSLLSSLSLSQQNEVPNLSNNYLSGTDMNRQSNFLQYQQHQLLQDQSNHSSNENILQNSLVGSNMSKFFDFHKNQQQKLQQHHIQNNVSNNIGGGLNDNLHMMLDNSRLNSHLMEQNCLLSSQQQQHQKQKVFGKMDQLLGHHQLQQPPQNQPHSSVQSQQNQFVQNSSADDNLGFDPFIETQKALAKLIENEEEHQNVGISTPSKHIPHKPVNNQQQQQPHSQQHMMDYMHRTRMPPPGFSHVNNFGNYGVVPRLQNNSKIMPFMNLPNNYTGSSGQPNQQQQRPQPQLQVPNNAWSTHLGNFQQQMNDQQIRQVNSNQLQSGGGNQKGYTGNDWTAMDPAILSFRQFSFPQQTQVAPHLQPQQQDMFLQQLAQQQQQQQQQQNPGFNSQSQHLGGNVGIPNTILNSQQSSQAHVNANVQGMLEYLKTRQFV